MFTRSKKCLWLQFGALKENIFNYAARLYWNYLCMKKCLWLQSDESVTVSCCLCYVMKIWNMCNLTSTFIPVPVVLQAGNAFVRGFPKFCILVSRKLAVYVSICCLFLRLLHYGHLCWCIITIIIIIWGLLNIKNNERRTRELSLLSLFCQLFISLSLLPEQILFSRHSLVFLDTYHFLYYFVFWAPLLSVWLLDVAKPQAGSNVCRVEMEERLSWIVHGVNTELAT